MRFEDHPEVFRAAFEEELERRHPVKKNAEENGAPHTAFGQILHQQREVVAEIQVRLAG